MGRVAVRFIRASMSRSYHMLMAPAAPAPSAMQSTAAMAKAGARWPGATISPTIPVSTTSEMTRGFSSVTQSRTSERSCGMASEAEEAVTSLMVADPGPEWTERHALRHGVRDFEGRGGRSRPDRLASADAWQFFEGVKGRRAGHLPLQRRCTLAPVVVGQLILRGEGPVDDVEE